MNNFYIAAWKWNKAVPTVTKLIFNCFWNIFNLNTFDFAWNTTLFLNGLINSNFQWKKEHFSNVDWTYVANSNLISGVARIVINEHDRWLVGHRVAVADVRRRAAVNDASSDDDVCYKVLGLQVVWRLEQ